MTEQYNSTQGDGDVQTVKKSWSAPVLTQLGVPATQGGFIDQLNEDIFVFFGNGDCMNGMWICTS